MHETAPARSDPRPERRFAWHAQAILRAGLLAPCLGCLPPIDALAQPAPPLHAGALVTDVSGTAIVDREGRPHALDVLVTLEPHDTLRLGPDARVELVVTHGAGRVFRISGPGRFALRAGSVVALEGTGSVAARDLEGDWSGLRIDGTHLGRAAASLRGAPDSAILLRAPIGAQRPGQLTSLRWDRPYGRRSAHWSYDVRLVDPAGALVFATQTGATSVALPSLAWTAERDYLWTVTGTNEDGRRATGSAEFRPVGAGLQARIDALAADVARARARDAARKVVPEDVLYALALDQAGLDSEAAQQWQTLAGARPAFAARLVGAGE